MRVQCVARERGKVLIEGIIVLTLLRAAVLADLAIPINFDTDYSD